MYYKKRTGKNSDEEMERRRSSRTHQMEHELTGDDIKVTQRHIGLHVSEQRRNKFVN
jgi:hypothetical protein